VGVPSPGTVVGAARRGRAGIDWAYPVPLKHATYDDHVLKEVPGSARAYTQVQIDNFFGAVDWFPDEHPPMPNVVAHGRQPAVWACGVCHLASGRL